MTETPIGNGNTQPNPIRPPTTQQQDLIIIKPSPSLEELATAEQDLLSEVPISSQNSFAETGQIHEIGKNITLGEALSRLKQQEKKADEVWQCAIDVQNHPISKDDLHSLIYFGYEFSLHEKDGKIILTTGKEREVSNTEDIGCDRNQTRLYLHSHPEVEGEDILGTFLSTPDVAITDTFGEKTQLILVDKHSIVVFKRPQFDALRQINPRISVQRLMDTWGLVKGVHFSVQSMGSEDVSTEEDIALVRAFTNDMQMIVKEVYWNNDSELESIIDAINLKTVISDNKKPEQPMKTLEEVGLNRDQIESLPYGLTLNWIAERIDDLLNRDGVELIGGKRKHFLMDREARERGKQFLLQEIYDLDEEADLPEDIQGILKQLQIKAEALQVD